MMNNNANPTPGQPLDMNRFEPQQPMAQGRGPPLGAHFRPQMHGPQMQPPPMAGVGLPPGANHFSPRPNFNQGQQKRRRF